MRYLRSMSKNQRTAIHRYHTAMAYKLNSDKQRAAALFVRDKFMKDTEKLPETRTMLNSLPDAMKHE